MRKPEERSLAVIGASCFVPLTARAATPAALVVHKCWVCIHTYGKQIAMKSCAEGVGRASVLTTLHARWA